MQILLGNRCHCSLYSNYLNEIHSTKVQHFKHYWRECFVTGWHNSVGLSSAWHLLQADTTS